jgi:DNA-binding transcriptional ArsR family regulator
MKAGPDIALVASLVGDPARANMLTALMSGRALTATELAHEAGVTPQTASSHLARLQEGGLIATEKQGRHRYHRLTGPDVAVVLEGLMGLAARVGHQRTRTGPKDPALRHARVCYDHLAGDLGVQMFDHLVRQRLVRDDRGHVSLSPRGERFVADFGIDLGSIDRSRRPLCRTCLDWSARRSHLAGALGSAMLDRMYELKWASREAGTRIVSFTRPGERQFQALFGGDRPQVLAAKAG